MGGLVVRAMLATERAADLGAHVQAPGRAVHHARDAEQRIALHLGHAHRPRRAREEAGARGREARLRGPARDHRGIPGVLELLPYGANPTCSSLLRGRRFRQRRAVESGALLVQRRDVEIGRLCVDAPAAAALARARAVRDKIVSSPVTRAACSMLPVWRTRRRATLSSTRPRRQPTRPRPRLDPRRRARALEDRNSGGPADVLHGRGARRSRQHGGRVPGAARPAHHRTTSKLPSTAPVRRTAANEVVESAIRCPRWCRS